MQGLLLFLHFTFYKFGISTFAILLRYKVLFGSIMFILAISLSASMILVRLVENKWTQGFYYIASVWLGTILWLLCAVILARIAHFVIPETSAITSYVSPFLVLCAFVVSGYGLYHAKQTQVVRRDLYLANLPEAWEGKTGLFIADTHYGSIHKESRSRRDAAFIKSLAPDALFISGDFFDGPSKHLATLSAPYKEVTPPLGKFVISGNHDSYAGIAESIQALKEAGFIVLDTTPHTTSAGLEIDGVPYTTNAKSAIDDKATRDIVENRITPEGTPRILLKHVPIGTDIIRNPSINFAFFGHTHRGQMWPLSFVVKGIYGNHAYGFTTEDTTLFYTTSGLGSWGPPQRIGTDSEVLLVTFHKK